MGLQRDLGHLRDQPADRETIRTHCQILVGQHVFQLHSVHDGKGPLQQGLGHLESDEIMVLLRRIAILRDLYRVEPKLYFQMRRLVLRIPHRLAKLRSQFRKLDRDRLVDRRVARDIRRIVRQCAQREGVLVGILAFEQQLTHEISAANVMHQVAKIFTAEWVITQILDDGASVGVGMGLLELVL